MPKVDAVIISHNHYDHLDYDSVVELNKKFGNEKSENGLNWFVGLGLFAFNRYDVSKTLYFSIIFKYNYLKELLNGLTQLALRITFTN